MQVIYTTDRTSIRHIGYAFLSTRFGQMLTAWCDADRESKPDNADNATAKARANISSSQLASALCFATFTRYLGKERAMAELRSIFPAATLQQIDSKENIIDYPPTRILLAGTPFRLDVWRALLRIERGQRATYAELAALAGHPTAVRAVATSVGCNPISVVVPCHRIVPASGGIGNYHSGAAIKEELLRWEGALP